MKTSIDSKIYKFSSTVLHWRKT